MIFIWEVLFVDDRRSVLPKYCLLETKVTGIQQRRSRRRRGGYWYIRDESRRRSRRRWSRSRSRSC